MAPETQEHDQTRKEWMQEHLPYEINMLNSTHRLLDWTDVTLLLNGVLINALIESYCVHARALIELFKDEDNAARSGGKLAWKALTDNFQKSGTYDEYRRKLNNQIAHLGDERTCNPADKITREDRVRLTKMLRDDLSSFKQCLKQKWSSYPLPDIADPSLTLGVTSSQQLSATGAVSLVTGTYTDAPGQTTTTNLESYNVFARK